MPRLLERDEALPGEIYQSRIAREEWIEKNSQFVNYGEKLIAGAPSLVVLKRK